MPLSRASTARRAVLALLPLLTLPVSAEAATTLSVSSAVAKPLAADTDQIISPGESFDLITHMDNTGSSDFPGGNGALSNGDGLVSVPGGTVRGFSEVNNDVSNDPDPDGDAGTPAPSSGTSQAVAPYRLTLNNNFQCGKNVQVGVTITPTQGNDQGPFNYAIPTGAPGALRTYGDIDGGGTLVEGGKVESLATVPVPAAGDTVANYVRGARVHLDTFSYKYTPHWFKIQLVSPDGKVATLYDDTTQDRQLYPGQEPAFQDKSYDDITFVSKGDPSGIALNSGNLAQFTDHAVIQANDDLSGMLSGATRQGNWTLRVVDVPSPGQLRIGGRTGSTSSRAAARAADSSVIGTLGDWQLGVNAAVCGPKPADGVTLPASGTTYPTPDAWFGGADPVVIAPATAATLSAGASIGFGQGTTISGYAWDTHTDTSSPAAYTDATGSTLSLAPQARGPKIVKLKVSDSRGGSGYATRTVIVSETPTVDVITAKDRVTGLDTPSAGNPIDLTTTVSDSAGADKIATIEWDLDGNGTFDSSTPKVPVGAGAPGSATATNTTTFATSGIHLIRVRVRNDLGVATIKTLVVSTANLTPLPKLSITGFPDGSTPVVAVGQSVTFDGTRSADPDGTIELFEWNQDTGNTSRFVSTAKVGTFTTTFTQAGIYQVELRVTDNSQESDVATRTIKVSGLPIAIVTGGNSAVPGATVAFSGETSRDTDPGGSIVAWDWDLDGNGSFETAGKTTSKLFPNAGNATIKLRVTDDDGLIAVVPWTVVVKAATVPGGPTGGGGTPIPTPKPSGAGVTPAPTAAIPNPQTAPGTVPGTQTEGTDAASYSDPFREGDPPAEGSTPNGFLAKFSAASKFKAKKVYKKGFAAKVTANAAGSVAVKAMITKKDAKAIGIKSKAAMMAIGTGKLTIKKSGSAKFTVVFTKKYQKNVKRSKKLLVTLRGVVTGPEGDQLALSRKVYIVK